VQLDSVAARGGIQKRANLAQSRLHAVVGERLRLAVEALSIPRSSTASGP
jgi:hypothetical protein